MQIKKLAIFCGSSSPKSEKILQETTKFLQELFANGDYDVVYGGAKIGIMGLVADLALEESRLVYGVMPTFLIDREVDHPGLTDFEVCETMHERKEKMYHLSDAFLILPGGFGTLDELFEILTWRQLQLHHKPIYIFNPNGFYDHLIEHIKKMSEEGLIGKTDHALISPITEAKELS